MIRVRIPKGTTYAYYTADGNVVPMNYTIEDIIDVYKSSDAKRPYTCWKIFGSIDHIMLVFENQDRIIKSIKVYR